MTYETDLGKSDKRHLADRNCGPCIEKIKIIIETNPLESFLRNLSTTTLEGHTMDISDLELEGRVAILAGVSGFTPLL